MTNQYPYHLVDVFTDRAFGGNPLAVFVDGGKIPESVMQPIAREMNLSETTFVLPPANARNDFRVRIFTPAAELPMAGHPTIGTAFILACLRLVRQEREQTTITFEEGVGPVPVTISWRENNPGFIEMEQSRPDFATPFANLSEVAAMLSLEPETIRATHLPVQIVSCGVPYLLVPLSGLEAIRRVRFRMDLWEKLLRDAGSPDVLVFTTEVECAGSTVHSRMFAPAHGIAEDPATGSAAGPLGCYLLRHRVLPFTEELQCVSEQGIEMGRPSFLHVRIAQEGGEITVVRVGGECHYMGAGHLELDL